MPIFQKDGSIVLFIHIPKAGGTSIEQTFLANGWNMRHFDSGEDATTINPVRKCSPQHQNFNLLNAQFRLERFTKIFCVVRNPLDRIISEYRWQRQHFGVDKCFADWLDCAFDSYSVDRFVFDNHIRPQHYFLGTGVQVFRLEDGIENCIESLIEEGVLSISTRIPERAMSGSGDAVVPNSQIAMRIREFYAEDYIQLGYK